MLQQTTVKAVGPYYARFLGRWPDVRALAAAPLDDVLKAWAGLGYYARARNLHACAKAVVERHGGRFPDTEAALRALPGIGAYTAAAIAAIAFDRRAVAGRRQHRARDRAALSRSRTRCRRPSRRSARCAATLVPAAARRRFRAGDDGSRRHHLHAEEAGLRHLSVDASLRGARARRRRRRFRARRRRCEGTHAPRRRLRRRARRRSRAAAHAAGEGPARRHDRGADDRMDARFRRTTAAAEAPPSKAAMAATLPGVVEHVLHAFPAGQQRVLSRARRQAARRRPDMRWVALARRCRARRCRVMRKVIAHAHSRIE